MATKQITVQNKKNKKEKIRTVKASEFKEAEPSQELRELVYEALDLCTSLTEKFRIIYEKGLEEGLSTKAIRKFINEESDKRQIPRSTVYRHIPDELKALPRGDPGGLKKKARESENKTGDNSVSMTQTDDNSNVTNTENTMTEERKDLKELLGVNTQEGQPVVDPTKSYADILNKNVKQQPAAAAVQYEQMLPEELRSKPEEEYDIDKLEEYSKEFLIKIVRSLDPVITRMQKEYESLNTEFIELESERDTLKEEKELLEKVCKEFKEQIKLLKSKSKKRKKVV
jgi:hypothetical protein